MSPEAGHRLDAHRNVLSISCNQKTADQSYSSVINNGYFEDGEFLAIFRALNDESLSSHIFFFVYLPMRL